MSQLRLKGCVRWMSGAWGANLPAEGVTVAIHQNSVNPTEKREIWRGVTGAAGAFEGTSAEWRRLRTVRFGHVESTQPDPTDIMALSFDASLNGHSQTGPFPYLGELVPSPPILLGWEPGHFRVAEFGGATCYSIGQFGQKAAAWISGGANSGLEVAIHSPAVLAAMPGIELFMNQICARLNDLSRALRSGAQAASNGALVAGNVAMGSGMGAGVRVANAGVRAGGVGIAIAGGGYDTMRRGMGTGTQFAKAGMVTGREHAVSFGTNMANHAAETTIGWLFGLGDAVGAEGMPALPLLPSDPIAAKRLLAGVIANTMRRITERISEGNDWLDERLGSVIPRIIAFVKVLLVESNLIEMAWIQARIAQLTSSFVGRFVVVFCATLAAFVCRVMNTAANAFAHWNRSADRVLMSVS